MRAFAMTVLVLVCALSLADAAPRISPELEPKSSKKFFGKDYPADKRPAADKHYHFNHPYPAVQDTGDYDRDFVSDENTDGGKWAAQMKYDTLRQKVSQAEKEMHALEKKMQSESQEMQEAYKRYEEALEKVRVATGVTNTAQGKEAVENKKVWNLEDKVHAGANKAEKELQDLEKCKKALADAKQRLKELLEKQAAAEKKAIADKQTAEQKAKQDEETKQLQEKKKEQDKKQSEENKKKVETDKLGQTKKQEEAAKQNADNLHKKAMDKYSEEMKSYNKQLDTIESKKAAVEKKRAQQKKDIADAVARMEKDEAEWQKKLNEEKAEYGSASSDYDQVMRELHETEAALAKAATTLKTYRRLPNVDDNGGVYNVPRSFAAPAHLSAVAMSVMLAALAY